MEFKQKIKVYGEELKQCAIRRQQLNREYDALAVRMNELAGGIKVLQDLEKEGKKTKNGKKKVK